MTADSDRIADIRARRAAITPTPWWITSTTVCRIYGADAVQRRDVFTPSLARVDHEADAAFIAAAPDDIDTLLSRVAEVEAECERLRSGPGIAPNHDELITCSDCGEGDCDECRRALWCQCEHHPDSPAAIRAERDVLQRQVEEATAALKRAADYLGPIRNIEVAATVTFMRGVAAALVAGTPTDTEEVTP